MNWLAKIKSFFKSKPEGELYAVYGTLKRGFPNHRILADSEFLGRDWTDPEFIMVDLGAFPGVIPAGCDAISVEVYRVDRETELKLDRLEGYPGFYQKIVVDTKFGSAWMYILDGEMFSHLPRIHGGYWYRTRTQ
jgi:gamma-glutamylaminecyclotransferase